MSGDSLAFLESVFDPSGNYFASAITSLDLNKVQISPAGVQSTNALQAEYTLPKGVAVKALAWVYSDFGRPGSKKAQKKKRKRSLTTSGDASELSNLPVADIENAMVAIGTNKGDILLFSPAQSAVAFTLSGVHAVPITSLTADSISRSKLWSCDNTGRVAEWDLTSQKNISSFVFTKSDVSFVQSVNAPIASNGLLLASNTVYLINSNNPLNILKTFPSFLHPTSSLVSSSTNPDIFFAASHSERNIGVISYSKEKTVGLLVAQSDVKKIVVSQDSSAVCAVTEDGFVEVFSDPLGSIVDNVSNTPKSKSRKSQAIASVSSTTTIKVSRPTSTSNKLSVKIQNAWFRENHIVITWTEHGSVPVFEQVKWRDELTGKAISQPIELIKSVKVLNGNQNSGVVDSAAAGRYQESQTLVKSGADFSKLDEQARHQDDSEDEDEAEGGTLADRLDALEVSDAKRKSEVTENTTSLTSKRPMKTPESFAIVLAQALKTNDHSLLETCLSNKNEEFIQTSVKRLDSSLAVILLERIAEKVARTPTRTASLTIWIKWVMITHGGYLVTLPNLTKSLASLHSTLANKISMLPRLLALQGRVEMLRAQMKLRREILATATTKETLEESDVDSEVEYVEDAALIVNGEEDFDEEEDDDDDDITMEGNGFIELEAEESDDMESEEEDENEGMSDVEAEGLLSDDGIEFDEEELSDQEPVKNQSKIKSGSKSKKRNSTNGKFRR